MGALILIAIFATYFGELRRLAQQWWDKPDYVHGFLVVPFSVYLTWCRRALFDPARAESSYWGLALLIIAIAMRSVSAYVSDPIIAPMSIVPSLFGGALLVGGWQVIRWIWPSVLFLVFMIPLPDFMESWGNIALQNVATQASTFTLQAIGIPAASFGNIIMLTNAELGVEEACSGLRSTILFFAVSFGAAFLISGVPERFVVLLAAIPAAICANVIRIVATGLLYQYSSKSLAEAVFHDLFGFFMLPLAASMLWVLIKWTRFVLVSTDDDDGLLSIEMATDAN